MPRGNLYVGFSGIFETFSHNLPSNVRYAKGEDMNKRRSNIACTLWLLPAVLWLIVLFYFSGQNGTDSGELSSGLAEKLLSFMPYLDISLPTMEFILRKTAHFGIFAVEGFLLRLGFGMLRPGRWGNVLLSVFAGAGIAVLNELHQLTSAGRYCSVADMLLDSCGVLAGAVFAALIDCTVRELKRRQRRTLDR